MVTRDEIPENDRIYGGIEVIVHGFSPSSKDRVDYKAIVEDGAGHAIPLDLWSTHDLSLDLNEGHRYELRGVRGKKWTKNETTKYRLSSTKSLTAIDKGPAEEATRLLVVGDTHVGYRRRKRSKKRKWAWNIDARDSFRKVLERANEQYVDAVIHAGDIFDHVANQDDREFFTDLLTSEFSEIPFYYIYGNHDEAPSRRALDTTARTAPNIHRLGRDGVTVGPINITLFGIDHSQSNFPGEPLRSTAAATNSKNVLVLHETPYPVRNGQGQRIHRKNGADLRDAIAQTDVDIDLIICGHMHVGKEGKLEDMDMPVVVTGPPDRISKSTKENEPSTWLVTGRENKGHISRHPL